MDINRLTTLTVIISVAVVILGVGAPIVASISTETVSVSNDGAQWVRMAYLTDSGDYTVSYAVDGDNITITNGDDSQTGAVLDTVLYADESASVYVDDGTVKMLSNDGTATTYATLSDSFTVARSGDSVTITDGSDNYSHGAPAWAYVPLSTASYGVFNEGGLTRYNSALACTGSFAGVECYNGLCNYDLGLVMDADATDDYITSVKWVLDDSTDDADAVATTTDSNAKIVLGASASPPTASYTSGDWGYNLSGNNAIIVSYTGATGGALTIPATIDSYTVTAVGLGSSNSPVVDTSSTFTDLVISSGITTINANSFQNCSGFTGTLTIPDSVTSIGSRAFQNCSGFTGSLTIPDSVTSLGSYTFQNCSGFTGTLTISNSVTSIGGSVFTDCRGFTGTLTIPDSVTSISTYAFNACRGFTGTLTIPDSVTSIGGSAFNVCSGFTGTLTIPDSVTSIGNNAFQNCSGFTGTLTIPDSVTSIGNGAFNECSGITNLVILSNATPGTNALNMANVSEVLNLSDVEYTTTSYGLNADEIKTDIPADNYLCVVDYSETAHKSGAVFTVIDLLPLIMGAGLVVGCIAYYIQRKQ